MVNRDGAIMYMYNVNTDPQLSSITTDDTIQGCLAERETRAVKRV